MLNNEFLKPVDVGSDEEMYFSCHAKRMVYTWFGTPEYKQAFPPVVYDFYLTNKRVILEVKEFNNTVFNVINLGLIGVGALIEPSPENIHAIIKMKQLHYTASKAKKKSDDQLGKLLSINLEAVKYFEDMHPSVGFGFMGYFIRIMFKRPPEKVKNEGGLIYILQDPTFKWSLSRKENGRRLESWSKEVQLFVRRGNELINA